LDLIDKHTLISYFEAIRPMCTLSVISWAIGIFLSWFFLYWIPYFRSFETVYNMLDLEFCARRYNNLKLRQSCCPKFAQANFASLEQQIEFSLPRIHLSEYISLKRIYQIPGAIIRGRNWFFGRILDLKGSFAILGEKKRFSAPWLRTPGFGTLMELGGGRIHSTKFIFMGFLFLFPFIFDHRLFRFCFIFIR